MFKVFKVSQNIKTETSDKIVKRNKNRHLKAGGREGGIQSLGVQQFKKKYAFHY